MDTRHIKRVHNSREKRQRSDLAGIDVADELGYALRGVCTLLQQDNRCGLEDRAKERPKPLKKYI